MTQIQASSIAEITRDKLLCEATFKDRDLRRLVAHVNLYDRLLDALEEEEPEMEEHYTPPRLPPRPIEKSCETNETHRVQWKGYAPPTSQNDFSQEKKEIQDSMDELITIKADVGVLGYTSHRETVDVAIQEAYTPVQVVEVEVSDDSD